MKLLVYEASAFQAGSLSYASQGRCSFCGQGANYMNGPERGARKAYCTRHAKKHLSPNQVRVSIKSADTGSYGDALASICASLRKKNLI